MFPGICHTLALPQISVRTVSSYYILLCTVEWRKPRDRPVFTHIYLSCIYREANHTAALLVML